MVQRPRRDTATQGDEPLGAPWRLSCFSQKHFEVDAGRATSYQLAI
jgi:hypothetical protein